MNGCSTMHTKECFFFGDWRYYGEWIMFLKVRMEKVKIGISSCNGQILIITANKNISPKPFANGIAWYDVVKDYVMFYCISYDSGPFWCFGANYSKVVISNLRIAHLKFGFVQAWTDEQNPIFSTRSNLNIKRRYKEAISFWWRISFLPWGCHDARIVWITFH